MTAFVVLLGCLYYCSVLFMFYWVVTYALLHYIFIGNSHTKKCTDIKCAVQCILRLCYFRAVLGS